MRYETIDAIVVTTPDKRDSLRLSLTESSAGHRALVWSFPFGKTTSFEAAHDSVKASAINFAMSSMMGDDGVMLDELDTFTNHHCN
jgi:hypothetical protein